MVPHTFPAPEIPPELTSAQFRLSPVTGFGRGPSVFRFDPSGILQIDGTYHVYYTRFTRADDWFAMLETPNHTQIWLATSSDGWNWQEYGQVLADSPDNSWHRAGKHAPHVIEAHGMFYMFYTAHVGPDYFNKRIGMAQADSPAGPFRHCGQGPLLDADTSTAVFDTLGQDDSCVLQRGSEFWWYFKGYGIHPDTGKVINDRLCLAIAEAPEGPYTRYEHNPVTLSHTGCLWPHGQGIAMIADVVDTSDIHPYPTCIQYSPDGIHFARGSIIHALATDPGIAQGLELSLQHWGVPTPDAGVYCPVISDAREPATGVGWGLCQLPDGEHATDPAHPHQTPFIVRFDCNLGVN